MRRHGRLAPLAAAVPLAIAVAACASPTRQAPPATAHTAEARGPLPGPYDTEKSEIADLWMQIRGWRVDMGMPTEPRWALVERFTPIPVKKLRLCEDDPRPRTDKCIDVCKIADAICDNAEQICRIADQLEDDSWANDKCHSAKASCKEATGQCCECAAQEAASGNVCAP